MAIQKAPKKTYKTPKAETVLVPNGSAEITTPKKPIKIAKTLITVSYTHLTLPTILLV